ncbi:hypothetical protein GR168_08585 [Gordonia sp. JH63]|uniref:hypothetical protein n=1 Tax=Gordonia TaxID=2053 RepID=UPI0009F4487C|nr:MULTISPECIES: hypothetical protein [Gordonia]QHD85435.1 hypothetical protein GR168_08585 [Gordonia sp. JH63]UPG69883.1 hypothetical protein MVF96_08935 [Gordonia hongkongensis]
MRKRLTATMVASAAALTLAVGGASEASAAPTQCTKGGGFTYSDALCKGGNGSYQAYAVCFNTVNPKLFGKKFVQSSWQKARSGKTARVWCPAPYAVESRGIGLRN